MQSVQVPIPLGELFDKISVLQIKYERILNVEKLKNIGEELKLLTEIGDAVRAQAAEPIDRLLQELKSVNEAIWEAEDKVRQYDRNEEFGDDFVMVARSTYRNNDRRAALKRQISVLLGSTLMEEKSHAPTASSLRLPAARP